MNSKIEKLIKQFAKLPRVGGRAAQRIVLALLQDKTGRAAALAGALSDAALTIAPCPICGVLTNNSALCEFCLDESRANGQLCIARDLGDVWTMEKSGVFRGRYHILGGQISGISGITPDDLNIASLPKRVKDENISEIIFVLPNTVEGKTTQHYVMSVIGNSDKIVFSELASGVPLGGDLDYLDDGTLSLAFGRRAKI
ncbi:MAG: recombination mediator RecR [Rickettsiales bacterium]|jgi:recombination protein RecR|nr:recombination mediator RecR [Rickettsiales bacterium]